MTKRMLPLILSLCVLLQGAKLKDPRTMEFGASLEFTPHEVERFTLSNGIEVFFVQDHEVPITDIYFSIRAGEDRVSAENAGLAEMLADLIVEGGSKAATKRVFEDSLENFGASFWGYAGTDYAGFTLHLLSEHIPDLLPMVVDVIREPALPQTQLEINKGQRLTSYQGRNTEPSSIANRVFYKLLYGKDSPRAREITPAALQVIDVASLAEFHQANYRPEHTMIGVVGDFEPKVMLDLLERYLGDWQEPETQAWEELDVITESADPGVYLVQRPESVQSNIHMGYLGLLRNDPRYPQALMLSEIFGSSWSSRLHNEVRDERGLAYVTYGWISGGFVAPGSFAAVCITKSETTLQAGGLMVEIIEALSEEGVAEDELKLAKDSWLASFPARYEEPARVLRDRMRYARYGYPVDFWDKMPGRIEPLTCEDVGKFAAEFLKPEDLIILILGDTTAMDGSVSELGEVQIIDSETY